MPRLERAPISHCGTRWRRDLATVSSAWLADAGARYACGADHRGGRRRLARRIRHKPERPRPSHTRLRRGSVARRPKKLSAQEQRSKTMGIPLPKPIEIYFASENRHTRE